MAALTTDAVLTLLQEVADEAITPRFRALADDEIGAANMILTSLSSWDIALCMMFVPAPRSSP